MACTRVGVPRTHQAGGDAMTRKAPRRTAERIVDTTLELFNRFGEPNVPLTRVAAEMCISPGNLHYHYPNKDELVNALFDHYQQRLGELLDAAGEVRDVEDAWFFLHTLFERLWDYRFLYRDLNDLLSRNLRLERQFQAVLAHKSKAIRALLDAMSSAGAVRIDEQEIGPTATSMVVVLCYWLSYEYVRDPRHALEPEHAEQSMLRGAHHMLHLLVPYLEPEQRRHLRQLAGAYYATAAP
jgi:AcrR family transcriptional regulator